MRSVLTLLKMMKNAILHQKHNKGLGIVGNYYVLHSFTAAEDCFRNFRAKRNNELENVFSVKEWKPN